MRNEDCPKEALSLLASGALPDFEAKQLQQHVEGCEVCRAALHEHNRVVSQLRQATDAEMPGLRSHPPEELLVAYVRGDLPHEEAQSISAHLDQCTSCAELVSALERLPAGEKGTERAASVLADGGAFAAVWRGIQLVVEAGIQGARVVTGLPVEELSPAFAVRGQPQHAGLPVRGFAWDAEGGRARQATVIMHRHAQIVEETTTDERGYFEFSEEPPDQDCQISFEPGVARIELL